MEAVYDGQDPCKTCVFKYNELLGAQQPCGCCLNGSEYISEDETIIECGWMDDPKIVDEVMTIIDEIHLRLDALDMLMPGCRVKEMTRDAYNFLTVQKKTIVDTYIKGDPVIYGTPCYERLGETETCLNPPYDDYCQEHTCPF